MLATRQGGGAGTAIGFFVTVIVLLPLGLGPDQSLLQRFVVARGPWRGDHRGAQARRAPSLLADLALLRAVPHFWRCGELALRSRHAVTPHADGTGAGQPRPRTRCRRCGVARLSEMSQEI